MSLFERSFSTIITRLLSQKYRCSSYAHSYLGSSSVLDTHLISLHERNTTPATTPKCVAVVVEGLQRYL